VIQVLDHGYVKLLNLAGPTRRPESLCDADDTDPANVARMSFGQKDSGRTREMDLRLASYLMQHRHSEPFEFIECWFQMKLPLFVAAQFKRHRTARLFEPVDDVFDPSINEMSLRYTEACTDWYVPSVEQIGKKAASNKQGRGDAVDEGLAEAFRDSLNDRCLEAYRDYEYFLEEGIAPEVARLFLHVNHYTEWVWKQDLWNMLHFLSLRMEGHPQWEAQQYANAIHTLLSQHLPESMRLFDTYAKQSR
jgi:thymidylate synthase (FAD)